MPLFFLCFLICLSVWIGRFRYVSYRGVREAERSSRLSKPNFRQFATVVQRY